MLSVLYQIGKPDSGLHIQADCEYAELGDDCLYLYFGDDIVTGREISTTLPCYMDTPPSEEESESLETRNEFLIAPKTQCFEGIGRLIIRNQEETQSGILVEVDKPRHLHEQWDRQKISANIRSPYFQRYLEQIQLFLDHRRDDLCELQHHTILARFFKEFSQLKKQLD